MTSSTLINNTALYSGGFYGGQFLDLTIIDSTFENNIAEDHGGAIECSTCESVNLTAVQFTGNQAKSAGALSLKNVSARRPATFSFSFLLLTPAPPAHCTGPCIITHRSTWSPSPTAYSL